MRGFFSMAIHNPEKIKMGMLNCWSFVFILLSLQSLPSQGYYKDIFMDGGVGLTSRTVLPVAHYLDLSMEYIATSDSFIQNLVMISNPHDKNGALLYPDGQPRFRMIYTNGGWALGHGNSLGETGRERIRTFYRNGGSYSGSCAGAFIICLSTEPNKIYDNFYQIWNGRMKITALPNAFIGHFIQEGSALLDFYDYGNDSYVAQVPYNNGGYAIESVDFPEGTEILARYDYPDLEMHNKVSIWSYKNNQYSGRLVVAGSHPEVAMSGEILEMFAAMVQYALAGAGEPVLKGQLHNGQTRIMNRDTDDNDPPFTKIGDYQYHHFTIDVAEGAKNLHIFLEGERPYPFNLYLKKGNFAFKTTADFADTSNTSEKDITVTFPEAGPWYVAVECDTSVTAEKKKWGFEYKENLDMLNGVSYNIKAIWDTVTTISADIMESIPYQLAQNYPNPFNPVTAISYQLPTFSRVDLSIYNLLGQKVATLVSAKQPAGKYEVQWDASGFSSGVYFYQLSTDQGFTETRKLVLLR